MALLTRADVVALTNVSKQAVSKAIKTGLLAQDKNQMIDTDHPTNKKWLDRQKQKKEQPTKEQPQKEPEPTKPEEPDSELEELINASLERTRLLKARRILAESDTKLKDIKAATQKKELIPREMVRRKISNLDAAIKTNFINLPRRISAKLYAIAQAEDVAALERQLEKEISAALKNALESISGDKL